MYMFVCIYISKNMHVCVIMCVNVCRSNTKLVSGSGTPTACSIVVGVVATLLQRFPDYTPHQIEEQLIRESTKDVINFHTRNGQNLSSIIAETLPNRLAYTGKCINSKIIIIIMITLSKLFFFN